MVNSRTISLAAIAGLLVLTLSSAGAASTSASVASSSPEASSNRHQKRATARQRQTLHNNSQVHAQISTTARYPYTVSLLQSKDQSNNNINTLKTCGGSLIAKFAILTSASCADKFDTIAIMTAVVDGGGEGPHHVRKRKNGGNTSTGKAPDSLMFTTFQSHSHPNYNPTTKENDFMILLLPKSITNENAIPVQLNRYTPDDDVIPHELTLLESWEDYVDGGENNGSGWVKETALDYMSNNDCQQYSGSSSVDDSQFGMEESYAGKIYSGMACASPLGASPSEVTGDCIPNSVGGPLILKDSGDNEDSQDVLFGSVSWGQCNPFGFPSVYSRVSTAIDWIDTIVCGSELVLTQGGGDTVVPSSFSCSKKYQQRTTNKTRQSQSNQWPYSLSLSLTFDENPSEISWKLENSKSQVVLGGVAFGEYADEDWANESMVIPLDILTSDDYASDNSDPEDLSALRDYRFVMYDRGGNGLCCSKGNGKYELYAKGTLVVSGDSYGAIDEHFFTIDPRVFLDEEKDDGGVILNADNGIVFLPVVNVPVPPQATPVVTSNGNPPPTTAPNTDDPTPNPTPPPTTRIPTPKAVAVVPTLMQSFFCGSSFEDAQEHCHLPCPSGSPAECGDMSNVDFDAKDDAEFVCYASTTCRGRYVTPEPTVVPSRSPSLTPTKRPTPPPTSKPTNGQPTMSPTLSIKPSHSPRGAIPTTQLAMDSTSWFCGIDWDWIESHCDEAKPCPKGDAVDCPSNQACFASTPCTLSPTVTPTSIPSSMPSDEPTPPPTKSPWSEESFMEFVYASQNGGDGGTSSSGGGTDQVSSSSGGSTSDKTLASEVNEKLENYNSLQYHFYCGISWTHADETCDVFCPSGDKSDCPDGTECYANTRCDGRDTHPPTVSPAPSIEEDEAAAAEVEICSLCETTTLAQSKSISFQTQTTTCGNLNKKLKEEDISVESATCTSVRDMYRSKCCYDECQLCLSPDDTFLDVRSEHVVQQGGYEATCSEISNILSTTATKVDTLCTDARTQLGEECCYEQCALCGDPSESMSTEWYATVSFQGLTTTCLGLDYMLRAEQVSDGSDRCSALQGQYMDQCCYSSEQVPVSNSCELCKSDDVLYDILPSKTVTAEQSNTQSTTITCAALNDAMAKVETGDHECNKGKQAFFISCCGNAVVSEDDNDGSPALTVGGTSSNVSPVGEFPNPSPVGDLNPSSSGGAPDSYTGLPTTTSSPSSEDSKDPKGKRMTAAPTPAFFWGQDAPGGFSWDRNWAPPNGSYQAALSSLVLFISLTGIIICLNGLL